MSQKLGEFQSEYDFMRTNVDGKKDDTDAIDRELKKLQEKHRETIAQVHSLQTAREHLEVSVRLAQDELLRLNMEKEE